MTLKPRSRPLTVKLLSKTENPIGTLYYIWEQSRSNDPLLMPHIYEGLARSYETSLKYPASEVANGQLTAEVGGALMEIGLSPTVEVALGIGKTVMDTVALILDQSVPVTENIQFVFMIENMSISLREQIVRHRIGTSLDAKTGIDIIPDLAQSTWWSQTTRVLPLDKLYDEGRFYTPPTLKGKVCEDAVQGTVDTGIGERDGLVDCTADEMYRGIMESCQYVYNKLVEAGVPREDARQVIPLGMTHGMTWGLNLKALIHIFGKRGCWIAQANLWNDLMIGMITEMVTKVHPMYRRLIHLPCVKGGVYTSCPIKMINLERIQGRDGMPPCPLFIHHEQEAALEESVKDGAAWKPNFMEPYGTHTDIRTWEAPNPEEAEMLATNLKEYETLWGFQPAEGVK